MHFFRGGAARHEPADRSTSPFNPQRIQIQNKKLGRRRRPYSPSSPNFENNRVAAVKATTQKKKKSIDIECEYRVCPPTFCLGITIIISLVERERANLWWCRMRRTWEGRLPGDAPFLTQFVCFRKRSLCKMEDWDALDKLYRTIFYQFIRQKPFEHHNPI